MADRVDHTHGDTGAKPADSLNFQTGDKPDPEVFDWFWSEVPAAINNHADTLESIDSDGDGTVDAADTAAKVKGNDIDSNGDGKVDSADQADTATKVKGNDIDSNGDGTVDKADDVVAAYSAEGHDHTGTDENKIPDSGLQEDYVTNDTNTQVGTVVSSGTVNIGGSVPISYADLTIRRDDINNTVMVVYNDGTNNITLYETSYDSNKTYTASFGIESDDSVPYKIIEI